MERITDTIFKLANKSINKKDSHFMLTQFRDELGYCFAGNMESVLSLYMFADFGEGVQPYAVYDKYGSDTSVPNVKIAGKYDFSATDNKLLCMHTEKGSNRQIIPRT